MSSSPTASASTPRTIFPTFFLSHGGGPSYFMEVPRSHPFYPISAKSPNAQWLRDFTKTYKLNGENAPKAIVVISAHWETNGKTVRVTSKEQHTKLQYDYGGFPPETYKLQFNPKGDPTLSKRIVELLKVANLRAELDSSWNFDHGVFIPLLMIWPEANIPVIEISIDSSWDPAYHLAVGKALRSLKHEGVLFIGSGSSTHNFNPDGKKNAEFMAELQKLVEDDSLTGEEREKKLVLEWAKIPSARSAHPAEDHFVPFFAVIGAAEGQKGRVVGRAEPPGTWSLASVKFE